MKNDKYPWVSSSPMGRRALIKRLDYYGFVECQNLVCFLQYICDDAPGEDELRYISKKIGDCLDRHDNDDDYFHDLRKLRLEIVERVTCW